MTNLKCDFDIKGAKVLAFPPNDIPEGIKLSDGDVVVSYDGLTNYHESMIELGNLKIEGHNASFNDSSNAKRFTGSQNWKEFLSHLENGQPDVMDKIKEKTQTNIAELEKKYEHKIVQYKLDVSGDMFDVGMVLENIPECWIKQIDDSEDKPCIDINLNLSGLGDISGDRFIEGGARIIAICHIMEKMGIYTRIRLYYYGDEYDNRNGDRFILISCFLKNYNEPIDYQKASALINNGFLRRGGFRIKEVVAQGHVSYGMGCSKNGIKGLIDVYSQDQIDDFERDMFGPLKGEQTSFKL